MFQFLIFFNEVLKNVKVKKIFPYHFPKNRTVANQVLFKVFNLLLMSILLNHCNLS